VCRERALDERREILEAADVGRDRKAIDLAGEALEFRRAARRQDHLGAGARKCPGSGLADARRCAGNDHHFACE
jgi:hypothetical protein